MSPGTDPLTWFGPEDRPWFERDGWAESVEYRTASPHRRSQAASFRRTGVIVVPAVAPRELCRSVIEALEPHFERTGAPRITNAAWALEPLRDVAALPEIVDLLSFLYGRSPIAFQSLDFRHGTQQDLHADQIHFDSLPPGFMCGVWIALERVGPGQGPLVYAPSGAGVDRRQLVPFTAEAGDALVWSASLVHGGAPILKADATRWSHVTHYFFENCIWYTPGRSDRAVGELEIRLPIIDLSTTRPVLPRLGGRPARFIHLGRRRVRVVRPGGPVPSLVRRAPWRSVPAAGRMVAVAGWSRLTGRIPRQ